MESKFEEGYDSNEELPFFDIESVEGIQDFLRRSIEKFLMMQLLQQLLIKESTATAAMDDNACSDEINNSTSTEE